ncbi:MAG: TonB-dependent receptor [Woeseiaceae bacterium]|jgi:TonB-dependent receptor|nr:TonB-dependent receptor [Woeseiaceae bacterium]
MRIPTFTKTPLASGIALAVGAPVMQPALAQDDQVIEEVVVTGIRGSLRASMDLKRGADGVVDAITAEDIGNFPDTNLAESLQRITGVSIDRERGEGARVTVRGFGPAFNLVLLNGRQMPTTSGVNRDFDFSNLAAEGVSAVEVYKSGRADVPTGGIGSTINVKTTRPLENPGLQATIAASGMYDESVDHALGSAEFKPEVSGLFSNTFMDDKIGVSLSAVYQDRAGGAATASVGGWRSFTNDTSCWGCGGAQQDWGGIPTAADPNQVNRPTGPGIYSVPQSIGYQLSSFERERLNGQLTFQFRPIDSFTATVDYTYAEQAVEERWNNYSAWFNFGGQDTVWYDGPNATPAQYAENSTNSDFAMGASLQGFKNENDSVGLNLMWDVTDRFFLEFDAHSSTAENGPNSPYGNAAQLAISAFSRDRTAGYFGNELPILELGLNNPLTPDDMIVTGSVFINEQSKMDIDQARLSGSFEFDAGFVESVDFGVQLTEVDNRAVFANVQRDAWGGVTQPGAIADLMTPANAGSSFSEIPGAGDPRMQMDFYTFDMAQLIERTEALIASGDATLFPPGSGDFGPCGTGLCPSTNWQQDRRTTETSNAFYFQVNMSTELADMPIDMRLGARYEETDVESQALSPAFNGLNWVAGNELSLQSDGSEFTAFEGSYDYWLPNFDISMDITDSLVARASVSRTLTRPNFLDIQGGQTLDQLVRINEGTGRRGNPGLLPFVSDNLDLSIEYYYGESSYIAAGYFQKDVENFIGTAQVRETPFDVPHPALGPLGDEARAATGSSEGGILYTWILENRPDAEGVDADAGVISGVAGRDPASPFNLTIPVNIEKATVDGWEFVIQHDFGDSGFGVIANATIVDSDTGYDDLSLDQQFVISGLSDSANFVGYYDKNGLSVRLAYNWRDKFLAGTGQANVGAVPPTYTNEYEQWDMSANYWITDNLQVFTDIINLTDETIHVYGRSDLQTLFATQTGRRYNIGLRYKF